MKQLIRIGVFESNSSSSHSISVSKGDMDFVMDTIYPDQDGKILIQGCEFGWGWEKYNDSITKLAYVLQDQGSNCFDMIVEVVKEQTGALEVIFNEAGGYIDHDGCGTASEVCTNKESLRQFIFNKNSWLFIGNDNSRADPTFYDVPEFKGGRQIVPRYKYELVIKGLEKTTKYKDYPNVEELEDGIDSILSHGTLLTKDGHFIVEEGLFWQMSRPRGVFYAKSYYVTQDYSKNEILFLKESDSRFNDIEKKHSEDKRLRWDTKYKKITEEALTVPDLIKKVKFELKKL